MNDAYIVAIAENSEITVGSVDVFGETVHQLVLWGDDSTTPNVDGAEANESIFIFILLMEMSYMILISHGILLIFHMLQIILLLD